MRVSECAGEVILPFTVNTIRQNELKKLELLGDKIAKKEGVHFEGYSVWTAEPYSLEEAKPFLYFN